MSRSRPTHQDIIDRDRKYIVHGFGYIPTVFTEGHGAIVRDVRGKEYIDCISMTMGPTGIGHNHPRVVQAIKDQLEKIMHTHLSTINLPSVELAEKLAKITPSGLTKFHFVSSGADAVETAIKGAIRYTRKKEVISLETAYHGLTLGTLSLGQSWHRRGMPTIPGFRQIPPPYCYRCPMGLEFPKCDIACAKLLDDMVKYGTCHDVAAFIMEPLMGPAGHIFPPSDEYAKIIRETCDKHNILLIADEVQTGFGRTGKMWGSDYVGLKPDIMVLGKAFGGGMPLAGAVFREDIGSELQKLDWHGHTFSSSAISCAAASAVVDVVMEEKLPERSAKLGEKATRMLKEMQGKYEVIGDIRGPGLFIGLELVKDRDTKERNVELAKSIVTETLQLGAIYGTSHGVPPLGGNVIKFKPPMTIEEELMNKGIGILNQVFANVAH